MKGIILAAGVGSRLRPLTNEIPKCLVEVNGKSIIEYQIESYLNSGVDEIFIVTGYLQEKLVEFILKKYPNEKIKLINNKDYKVTNNMYSLYLLKDFIKDEFVMSNADVVFSKDMVEKLVQNDGYNLIAVDKGNYNEESMKIIVNDEKISSISKQISEQDSYGTSIDLYKFSNEARLEIFKEIDYTINNKNDLNSWTEVALNAILDKIIFRPFDIENRFWYEVDNYEDLKIAEKIVKESIVDEIR